MSYSISLLHANVITPLCKLRFSLLQANVIITRRPDRKSDMEKSLFALIIIRTPGTKKEAVSSILIMKI